MPHLTHDKAIEEYYEKIKDKYPGIDFKRFQWICQAPFDFIKVFMRKDTLPLFQIKYLGKIRPYSEKISAAIRYTAAKIRDNIGDVEQEKKKHEFLTGYLNALEDYDNERKTPGTPVRKITID